LRCLSMLLYICMQCLSAMPYLDSMKLRCQALARLTCCGYRKRVRPQMSSSCRDAITLFFLFSSDLSYLCICLCFI
jgi:hypothetical protein